MIYSNEKPIPLYGVPDLEALYGTRPQKNDRDLLVGIEMVLLPGSKIQVLREVDKGELQVKTAHYNRVLQVKTAHYKVDRPLYVDARHVHEDWAPRPFILPSYEQALERLLAIPEGIRYIYGANFAAGLPHLLEHFPPQVELTSEEKKDWTLEGLDCSGLFFEICEGATVRNCAMLPEIGETLAAPQLKDLRPLDLLLSPGHVVIVESSTKVIESAKRFNGVKRSALTSEVLEGCRVVRPFFKNFPVKCQLFD